MKYLALTMMILLSACQSGGGNFCQIASPIYLEKTDVIGSKTGYMILKHDETGMRLCGWKPVN